MGPLIHPPSGDLKRALTHLEPGESWALKPENIDNNPCMWTPGIKWGVQPKSYTHTTEFFGPLLGVMCAKNLDHAIKMVNQTGYGLTSGLESLDKREHAYWQEHINAGNLYINRETTGAVVLRQPFGGMGKSSLGGGIKAGGPNYVTQFMDFEDIDFPFIGAIKNDHALLRLVQEWKQKLNWGQMRGLVRYLPVGIVVVRVHPKDSLFEVLSRIAAAKISRCKPEVSLPKALDNMVTRFLKSKPGQRFLGNVPLTAQSDKELISMMPKIQRIRYAKPNRVHPQVFQAAAETGFYISRTPVMMEGRIELLQYFQEQSVCYNYHRYGNLGERTLL